jgi:4-amino-4-deoxy-L-arabinose transferase-like glycosyltransferase
MREENTTSHQEPPLPCGYSKEYRSLTFLVLVSSLALFFQLGSRSFENQCYIRYAEVAREMIRSGDWIVPRLGGDLFLHKPLLLVWLIAVPSALAGKVTPFLGRLPSALSALGGIVLTFFLARRLFGDYRVGLMSGLILLSSKEYFWQARIARTDMLLAFFILASLTCFYIAYQSCGQKRFWFFILFFAGMGFGTLTKGPPGILFPLGTASLFLFFRKRLRTMFEPGFLVGSVVFGAVVLPWFLLFLSRVGLTEFLQKFSVHAIFTRPEPFYYYALEFWPRFYPWALFLPAAVFFLFRKNLAGSDERLFCLCWIGLVIAVISPMHNKSYRYLLPAFPVYSIVLGAAWQEVCRTDTIAGDRLAAWWKISTCLCLIIFALAFVAGPVFTWYHTRSFHSTAISAFVLVMGGLLWIVLRLRATYWSTIAMISFLSLLVWETYFFFISREDTLHSPVKAAAEIVRSQVSRDQLATFALGDKALALDFYLDAVIPELNDPSEVVAFLTRGDRERACLMSESGYQVMIPHLSEVRVNVERIPSPKNTYYLVTREKSTNLTLQPPLSDRNERTDMAD